MILFLHADPTTVHAQGSHSAHVLRAVRHAAFLVGFLVILSGTLQAENSSEDTLRLHPVSAINQRNS